MRILLQSRDGWVLIVNRGTGQWGTDRDAALDIGRVSLASRTMAEAEETLTIHLIPEAGKPASGYAEIALSRMSNAPVKSPDAALRLASEMVSRTNTACAIPRESWCNSFAAPLRGSTWQASEATDLALSGDVCNNLRA